MISTTFGIHLLLKKQPVGATSSCKGVCNCPCLCQLSPRQCEGAGGVLVRFPRPTPRRWVGGPMPRKGGNETVLGSAHFRCSSMGECDTYLEFCMSKDSIGAAEFGFGQPCTAQGQFKSRKGAKRSPLRHPCDNLATTMRHPCVTLATPLRP